MVSMPAPGGHGVPRADVDGDDREKAAALPEEQKWGLLAACLGVAQPQTVTVLVDEMARASRAGARLFEVVTGAPHVRYGARITFETTDDSRDEVAAAVGLSAHPWGAPDWIGLRVSPAGEVVWKAYHRFERVASDVTVPPAFREALVPVMAARHGGTDELYFRRGEAEDWTPFVDGACNAVSIDAPHLAAAARPAFHPLPRAHLNSFGLSVKIDHGSITTLSFFADDRALPDDREIAAVWAASLDADDRAAYDAALACVRALGPRPVRGWHSLLAWSVDRRHGWSRAASLRTR